MKKLLYVFLAMTVAFAMVACKNGSTDNTPTVTSVAVTAAGNATSVAKGGTLQFNAVVTGTNSPAQTVTWTVEGGVTGTTITAGLLSVDAAETATSLTVRATSTVDTSKSGTKAVDVTGGSGPVDVIEQVFLDNGAYAFYKFDLGDTTWEDYASIKVDYKLDAEACKRLEDWGVRGVRLMGAYTPTQIEGGVQTDSNDVDYMPTGSFNAPWIIHNYTPNFSALQDLGMAADTWFTVTYNITGTAAHGGFTVEGAQPNLPAATATGELYFALGITGQNATDSGQPYPINRGILQLVRNVRLVGADATVEDLIAEPTSMFLDYSDPVVYCWRGAEDDTPDVPGIACKCGDSDCECVNCVIDEETGWCENHCCEAPDEAVVATAPHTVDLEALIDDVVIEGVYDDVDGTFVGIRNKVAITGGQWNAAFIIALGLPTQGTDQLEIRSYTKYTLAATCYESDGSTVVGTGNGQVQWTTDTSGTGTSGAIGGDAYALTTTARDLPAGLTSDVAGLIIKRNATTVAYIVVTELTLIP